MNSVNISGLSFVLLFPVYVIYNILIAYGLLPPFLGGYFGVVSLLCMVLIITFVFIETNGRVTAKNKYYFFGVVFFMLSIFTYSLFFYFLSDDGRLINASKQELVNIVLIFVMFLIGFNIDFYNKKLYFICFSFFVFFFIFIFTVILQTGNVMIVLKYITEEDLDGSLATYQGLARSLFVISIYLLAFSKNKSIFLFVVLLSVFSIFSLAARSELFGIIFSIFVLYFFKYGFKLKSFLGFFVLILVFFLGVLFFNEQLMSSRQFNVFFLSQDNSWNERKYLQELGFQQIRDNFLIGEFGGHAIRAGSVGGYIHNALSVWAGHGILYFVVYVYLCAAPVYSSFFYKGRSELQAFKVGLAFSCFLLIIFSKSMYWVIPGILWGVYLNKGKDKNSKV